MIFGNKKRWQQRRDFATSTKEEIRGIYEEKKGVYWMLLKTLSKKSIVGGSLGAFLSLYLSFPWVFLYFLALGLLFFRKNHSWEELKTQEGKNQYFALLCQLGICFFMTKFVILLWILGGELWTKL